MNNTSKSKANGDSEPIEVQDMELPPTTQAPTPQYDERMMRAFYYGDDPDTIGVGGRFLSISRGTLFPAIMFLVLGLIRVGLGLRLSEVFWSWNIHGAMSILYLGSVLYSLIARRSANMFTVIILAVWSLMLFL